MLLAFGVALLLAIVGVAALDRRWAKRRRVELSQALERSETRTAFNELMAAQSLFTAEVLRYEAAVEAQNVPSGTVRFDIYAPGQTPAPQPLERMKEEPRHRLLAAKQRWEQLRPAAVSDAGPPRWVGFGEVRTWGLFVIGGERAFLRFEHATDPSIWATVEISRTRLGLGLGVEVQRIGAVADHSDPSVLLAMAKASLDHTDVALRPGFDLVRAYRGLRQGGPFHRLAGLLRERSVTPAMWQGSSRDDVADARKLLDEMSSIEADATDTDVTNTDVTNTDVTNTDEIDLRAERITQPGILRCSVAGPSVMIGWWQSRSAPELRLLARSPHGEWSRRFDLDGQHVPAPPSASPFPSEVSTNSQV